ncbi:protein FANTASTIC FOUR 2 [Solanum dulcamara]|uniref:protein FANTASTIC FOUR 2 n=1 Tax=Solanum dulcamara TaxID=45834 RepID=UPI002485672C|nr:protein FANTASTIC FOUR 2 [Solanum dulcamara]
MGSTSILCQQHVVINKLCPPPLTSEEVDDIGGWSFIQDVSNPKKDNNEVYVHPLVKRSSNTLSIKSLEMCTESLGSETGSDISESMKEHTFETENSHLARRSKCKKHNRITNFPPPLTSIGVQVRQYRQGGRLILKATPISSCFKAERLNGRLRLSLWNNSEAPDDEYDNVDESDHGNRKLLSENGYIRPRKCKENGGRIKGIPSTWEPFWVAIS